MLQNIGERLLDDPVGGDAEAVRQRSVIALDAKVHRQAGSLHLLDQHIEVLNGRLRSKTTVLSRIVGAKHRHHASHLRERLAPGALDRFDGHLGLVLICLHDPPGGRGLDRHHADAVRDDVV